MKYVVVGSHLDPNKEARSYYLEHFFEDLEAAISYRNALEKRAEIPDSWMAASKAKFEIYKWMGEE